MKRSIFFILLVSLQISYSQWEQKNIGLKDSIVHTIAISDDNIIVGTLEFGTFSSKNNGDNWINTSSIYNVLTLLFKENILFAGTIGGIYLSTDYGITWNRSNNGIISPFEIHSLFIDGQNIYAAVGMGLYLSTDNGMGWIVKKEGGSGDWIISSIFVDENYIYTGIYSLFGGGGVDISTNKGNSWSYPSKYLTPNASTYTLEKIANNLFAGTGKGVYLSIDKGENWTLKNSGLTASSVSTMKVFGNYLFAGTFIGGIFISSDNGDSWTPRNSGLTNLHINDIEYNDEYIFAATDGGVFRIKINDIIGIVENEDQSKQLIFPNPVTTSFSLSQIPEGAVSYEIFDIFGGRVLSTPSSLRDATPQEGNFEIDVSSLTPGIYLLKLNNQTKPIKFIKL